MLSKKKATLPMERLEQLLNIVKCEFKKIEDLRQIGKISYKLADILLDNFLLFLLQFRSFRQFKKSYSQECGVINNYRINISSSEQRRVLDKLDPSVFRKIYKKLFDLLQRSKVLEKYVYYQGSYLVLLDGTSYYSSNNIFCPNCLTRTSKETKNYQHHALQLFITHPKQQLVIPLMAEEISNRDGKTKQDCETNAAKRAIKLFRKDHPKLKTILVGDGLYSEQPLIEELRDQNLDFILVAKPGDHKSIFEDIEGLRRINGLGNYSVVDQNGETHSYEWINDIMLNGNKQPIKVNYFCYVCSKGKQIIYKNSWVTDFIITKNNVKKLAEAGRCRWKCENEGFNVLKNQGYHLKHNYGHGKQYLGFNNYNLNLLSFLLHQICELKDKNYKKCCNKLGNKALIWQKIRDYVESIIFKEWSEIFEYILNPVPFIYTGIPPPA